MAYVGYSLTVDDESNALAALGDLKSKAPVALKNAANATAVRAKNMLIRQAKVRYALNTTGRRHVNELKIRTRATVAKSEAELGMRSRTSDLADFKTNPTQPNMGGNWVHSPEFHSGKVLKQEQMKLLTGDSTYSKGFLIKMANGHIGMVQRQYDAKSKYSTTARGFPRWKNKYKDGIVEKTRTYSTPSASAMHGTLWREGVSLEAGVIFQEQLAAQVIKILQKAGRQVL
jgi:hypothetical protein